MFRKIFILILLLFIGSSIFFFWQFHIVRTDDGIKIFSKEKGTFANTFLDSTEWGLLDYARFPKITQNLISKKISSLNKELNNSMQDLKRSYQQTIDQIYDNKKASKELQQQINEIQNEFNRKWKNLEKQLDDAHSEQKIQELSREKDQLVHWLKNEIDNLNDN